MNLSRLILPLLAVVVSLLPACKSPVPDSAELTHYYEQAEKLTQHDIQLLDAQLAAGQITQADHDQRKAALLANIQRRAVDACYTHHAMIDAERAATGLPTADHPMDIPVPTADSLPTGTQHRAFNSGDQNLGGEGNSQQAKQFFKGFTPGGNVRGSNNRAF